MNLNMKTENIIFITFLIILMTGCIHTNENFSNNAFSFTKSISVLGKSDAVFDTITGNIKPWWDHTFSDNPYKLYIEPYPGGGFYELFDDQHNGIRHAVVTAADKGKLLRLEGPLGMAGNAIHLVSTIKLSNQGSDSTIITIQVNAAGKIEKEWPLLIEKVWIHFIEERLKPYLEGELTSQ